MTTSLDPPDVSIVTISFNQGRFLAEAIESVLSQRGVRIDYIVVDPGSTDGSREIIDSYRPHLSAVILEPDNGPADGLNKGFVRARAEVLGYLNADDVLLPGALEYATRYFRSRPDVDVITGHGYVIDADGRRLRSNYSDRFSLRAVAYDACVSVQPSTFLRRSAYLRTSGFNESNRSNWDGELLVDMARAGARFARVDQLMSCHRMHPTSISGSRTLADAYFAYRRRMFETIVGRSPRRADALIGRAHRLLKHLAHPRATAERVLRGPIVGPPPDRA